MSADIREMPADTREVSADTCLKAGGELGLQLWVKPGCSRYTPKWCQNGLWLAKWPGLMSATCMCGVGCNNVSVCAWKFLVGLGLLEKGGSK